MTHVTTNRAHWDVLADDYALRFVTPEWARKWPVEEVWFARRRAS